MNFTLALEQLFLHIVCLPSCTSANRTLSIIQIGMGEGLDHLKEQLVCSHSLGRLDSTNMRFIFPRLRILQAEIHF